MYSLVCTSYVGRFLWDLRKLSFGIYSINPKDEKGNCLESLEKAIFDADSLQDGTQELKEWQAFFSHLKSFPDVNSNKIPDISINDITSEKRLNKISSFAKNDLFKNTSYVTWSVSLVLIVFILGFLILTKKGLVIISGKKSY